MGGFVVSLGHKPASALTERRNRLEAEIARAQAGDVEAFAALVDRHAPTLHRLASAIVGADDAEDATQEALLSAWRELPKLRDVERFEPWLRRILVNRCRKFLRGRSRRISPVSFDPARGHEPIDPGQLVDARIAEQSALDAVFEQLSPDQRVLLALHYTMDLSIRESAEALGIRNGTAKSRLNKALAALRAALDPEVHS